MQLLRRQQSVDAFRDLACAGLDLINTNQFESLVERDGYAAALGGDPVDAVRSDWSQALSDASGSEILPVSCENAP